MYTGWLSSRRSLSLLIHTHRLACYKRYALASATRSRTPGSESRLESQHSTAVGKAGKLSLSPCASKGLLYQSLAPAQERRLAQHRRNRQRGTPRNPGVQASSTSIGPARLLHFTCSTHVAPGERFFQCRLLVALLCPWFDDDDGEPSIKRLFLCFLLVSHDSHGRP